MVHGNKVDPAGGCHHLIFMGDIFIGTKGLVVPNESPKKEPRKSVPSELLVRMKKKKKEQNRVQGHQAGSSTKRHSMARYSLYQKVQMVADWPSPKNQHRQKKPSWWKVSICVPASARVSACGEWRTSWCEDGHSNGEKHACLARMVVCSLLLFELVLEGSRDSCCHWSSAIPQLQNKCLSPFKWILSS